MACRAAPELPPASTPAARSAPTIASATQVAPALTATRPVAAPAPAAALSQVSLTADVDYAAHRVRAQQVITYSNHTGQALDHLAFDVLAARQPGVFALAGGSVQGDPGARIELEGAALKASLSQALPPGQAAVVSISFTLNLPAIPAAADSNTGSLGWTSRQLNLGDWFPAVSAFRDGWAAERNPPHVVGETTAPEAVDIRLDLGLAHAPEGVQVLASAPGERVGERWRFFLPATRSFAASLVKGWQIDRAKTDAGVEVISVYMPEHASAGRAALQATTKALQVYGARYGPYRYNQLTVVEADFEDGMEYSGLYFLGKDYYAPYDGTPRNYLTAIAVHETAHQWWYGDVGNDQAREPWLDEALCIYSELIYYQEAYPGLDAWWWDFRVQRFHPAGWVNASVYEFDSFRPYVNAVYLRGALFLGDLRAGMGDEAFFDMLHHYRAAEMGRVTTAADFWSALQPYPVPHLSDLRRRYFKPG